MKEKKITVGNKIFLAVLAVLFLPVILVIFGFGDLLGSIFENKNPIIITFNPNGGRGEPYEQTIDEKEKIVDLIPNTFVRDGYVFCGWNTKQDGSGYSYNEDTKSTTLLDFKPTNYNELKKWMKGTYINTNTTLYAQWSPSLCSISFNPNGGTGEMQPLNMKYGDEYTLPQNAFTYVNHEFAGWNTSLDGNGVAYADLQKISIDARTTENMMFYAQWVSGSLNGHYYVDLGLPSSTKWATCNIGSENQTDYGYYFAWGEASHKSGCEYSNPSGLTKYCNKSNFGSEEFTDDLVILDSIDDAATANWGKGWRMPTKEELDEIVKECKWIWCSKGYRVIGPNGNEIFMSAAGSMDGGLEGTFGYYWSSSLNTEYPLSAYYLYLYNERYGVDSQYRNKKVSVRPVCK